MRKPYKHKFSIPTKSVAEFLTDLYQIWEEGTPRVDSEGNVLEPFIMPSIFPRMQTTSDNDAVLDCHSGGLCVKVVSGVQGIAVYLTPQGQLVKPDRYNCLLDWLRSLETPIKERASREGGPTARTQMRAEVFRRLKKEHPRWSQVTVAMKAQGELDEIVSADTVRNTYRAMEWEWERADRIR